MKTALGGGPDGVKGFGALKTKGIIVKVSGPTVVASGMKSAGIYHRVTVGTLKLLGEVIRLETDRATIQVYEDTIGLSLGEEVEDLGEPLMAELGPGLISSIFDGIQRPLTALLEEQGDFISRGFTVPALSRSIKWRFVPFLKPGAVVYGGDLLGTVQETDRIIHRIMVPPGRSGKIKEIQAGEFTVQETIAVLDGGIEISLMQRWPVRSPPQR